MKRVLSIFFLLATVSGTSSEASNCHQPESGPPGIQGPPGPSESAAFGSFFTLEQKLVATDELITFPVTTSNLNITHSNNTDFVIQRDGYYFINFGAANKNSDFPTILLALFVDGTEVPGSRLAVSNNFGFLTGNELMSIALAIPLQAGQTVTVKNVDIPFDLGFLDENSSVTAYINFVRIAPL